MPSSITKTDGKRERERREEKRSRWGVNSFLACGPHPPESLAHEPSEDLLDICRVLWLLASRSDVLKRVDILHLCSFVCGLSEVPVFDATNTHAHIHTFTHTKERTLFFPRTNSTRM